MKTKFLNYSKLFFIFFTVTILLANGITSYVFAADGGRIGFVDLQKAASKTKEWKRKLTSLKNEAKKEEAIIKRKEKRIKKMLDDLNKQSFVLDPTLKAEKEKSFRNEKKKFERYIKDLNEDFTIREREASQEIFKKMIKTVQKIGKEKKLSMIADKSTLIYFSKEQDLTNLATRAYDKVHK